MPRPRFTIRGLLILTTLIALACGVGRYELSPYSYPAGPEDRHIGYGVMFRHWKQHGIFCAGIELCHTERLSVWRWKSNYMAPDGIGITLRPDYVGLHIQRGFERGCGSRELPLWGAP